MTEQNPQNVTEAEEAEVNPDADEAEETTEAAQRPAPDFATADVASVLAFVGDADAAVDDADAMQSDREEYRTALQSLVRRGKSLVALRKNVALRNMLLRCHVQRNGHPDWAAQSNLWKLLVNTMQSSILAADVASSKAAVDMLISRTFRPLTVAWYVIRNADASDLPDGYDVPDSPTEDPSKVIRWYEEPIGKLVIETPALLDAFRAEFDAAGLAYPDGTPGREVPDGDNPPTPPKEESAGEKLVNASETLASEEIRNVATFEARAAALLRFASDLSADMLAAKVGTAEPRWSGRENALAMLERTAVVVERTCAIQRGKADYDEASKEIDAAKFQAADAEQ